MAKSHSSPRNGAPYSSVASLDVGDLVPDFVAPSQLGEIRFHDLISGSWCLFFSHPADFTPVCTTEFGAVAKLAPEFKARNCKILGLSIDSVSSHEAWIRDINETQETNVSFPIIADETGSIALNFSFAKPILNNNNNNNNNNNLKIAKITTRTLILIDPLRTIQCKCVYSNNVGRNFYEVLRTLDALQLCFQSENLIGTPANWKYGEDVLLLPEVGEKEAKEKFPKGFISINPYLRITPMPESI